MALISSLLSIAGVRSSVRSFTRIGPAVQISSSNMNLRFGATATLTFTLSAAPGTNGFTQSDISVSNGTLSGFSTLTSTSYRATLTPASNFGGNVTVSVASGAFNDVSGAGNNPVVLQIPAATFAPITFTGALYKALDNTLLLTGTNFASMLGPGDVTGVTDIKSRFDWSKISYDINSDSGTTDIGFNLADIQSAIVNTGRQTLVIKLTPAKAASLEATPNFGGVVLDTVDISAGFSRDRLGNASTTDGIENLGLPQTIILGGGWGNLIRPITVDGGSRFYHWDRNGNGNSELDAFNMGELSPIFNKSEFLVANTVTANGSQLTSTFRFANFNFTTGAFDNLNPSNSILLALAPWGGVWRSGPITDTPVPSANAVNSTYDGLAAVWDALNNSSKNGTPPGWQPYRYFGINHHTTEHFMIDFSRGEGINNLHPTVDWFSVALQVN